MPHIPKARLIFNEVIAYQVLGKGPEDLSPQSFWCPVDSDEQVWRREFKVGNEWTKLPLGWLDGLPLSRLILTNEEGKFTQVQPSLEEREQAMARVVEVGVWHHDNQVAFARVRPLQNFNFEPVGPIYVRCVTDSAKLIVVGVPG